MKERHITKLQILEFLKKEKKRISEQQNETKEPENLTILRNAIKKNCLFGGKLRKNQAGTIFYYRVTNKSGKVIDFFPDMTYKFVDGSKKGKWNCSKPDPVIQTELTRDQQEILKRLEQIGWKFSPIPTDFEISQGEYKKENLVNPQDAELLKFNTNRWFTEKDFPKGYFVYKSTKTPITNTTTGSTTTSDIQIIKDAEDGYELDMCTDLVDDYFEKAQVGLPDQYLQQRKNAIKFCHNKNRRNWKEETKDKLRWLRGNEEDAKVFLNLFRRYPRIGKITDTPERKEWRLWELPQI